MNKKPVLFNKTLIIVIIILFIGMIAISNTIKGEYWYTAKVKCNLRYLKDDAVKWKLALLPIGIQKRFILGLSIFTDYGSGTLEITPPLQQTITYNFPDDFKSFDVWFMRKMPIYGYIRLQPESGEPGYSRFECWAIGFAVFVN